MSALPNKPPKTLADYYRRLADAWREKTESRAVPAPPNAREWLPPRPAFLFNEEEHGMLARDVLLSGEDQDYFAQLRRAYFERYQPADDAEALAVDRLVLLNWRLLRCQRMEQGILLHQIHEIAFQQSWFARYYPALAAQFVEDRTAKRRRSSLAYDPEWMEEVYKTLDQEPPPDQLEHDRRAIRPEWDYDFCPPIPPRVLGWAFEHDTRGKAALLRLTQVEMQITKLREQELKYIEILRKLRPKDD